MLYRVTKVILALALFAISAAANAIPVILVTFNQTAGSGAITTLITDGSHVLGGVSTAVFDWDGTTLTSTGLYSATSSLGSSTDTASILNDTIMDLAIDFTGAGTTTATSYACLEGTFLAIVGASGCGNYALNTMGNESTTVWGPGTSVTQTLGGDDTSTGLPRSLAAYDFDSVSVVDNVLLIGNGIALGGNGTPVSEGGTGPRGGELMTFATGGGGPDLPQPGPLTVVPVPAAVWLFGAALGLLGWMRHKST